MSDKQFEECSLEEATHVEVNGKVHKFGHHEGNQVHRYSINNIEIRKETGGWQLIHSDAFSVLGIQPLKEVKPEPIEFEAVFVKHDGQWRQLLTIDDGISIQNCKVARFRCVEILEEKK